MSRRARVDRSWKYVVATPLYQVMQKRGGLTDVVREASRLWMTA